MFVTPIGPEDTTKHFDEDISNYLSRRLYKGYYSLLLLVVLLMLLLLRLLVFL